VGSVFFCGFFLFKQMPSAFSSCGTPREKNGKMGIWVRPGGQAGSAEDDEGLLGRVLSGPLPILTVLILKGDY
jgi:hypothetical protein